MDPVGLFLDKSGKNYKLVGVVLWVVRMQDMHYMHCSLVLHVIRTPSLQFIPLFLVP